MTQQRLESADPYPFRAWAALPGFFGVLFCAYGLVGPGDLRDVAMGVFSVSMAFQIYWSTRRSPEDAGRIRKRMVILTVPFIVVLGLLVSVLSERDFALVVVVSCLIYSVVVVTFQVFPAIQRERQEQA